MLYSLYLKKIALLDVFVLSSFYSFRILAGALISATPLSQWFLAFSMFFFLSLAMAKRYSELLHASDLVRAGNSGRGYHTGDRELLLSLGVGSSFSAVVIFSLYVHSQDVRLLYSSPEFLFLLCPIVLYWLSRTWLLAHRGELKEDPVTLAIRDPVSYGVAAAVGGRHRREHDTRELVASTVQSQCRVPSYSDCLRILSMSGQSAATSRKQPVTIAAHQADSLVGTLPEDRARSTFTSLPGTIRCRRFSKLPRPVPCSPMVLAAATAIPVSTLAAN